MNNFMRATDPRIQGTRFIDPQKLKDKEGMPVRIIKKGPLSASLANSCATAVAIM